MQKTNIRKVVTFGEVMMRLAAPSHARFSQCESLRLTYGGSEANVAVSLSVLGLRAEHVTCFPVNDFGKSAMEFLRRHGVATDHVSFAEGRMGLYFLENGASQRASRIIYDRADSAFCRIRSGSVDWDTVLEDADWFHWTGITPAISEGAAAVCREALTAARKRNIPVSADINYRRNLWGWGRTVRDVMPELISLSQYIVGGVTDLVNCLGVKASDFEQACIEAQRECPAVKVIATTIRNAVSASHNRLSAVAWTDGQLYSSSEYELTPIVDRIGGGDAFMAGLIFGWMNDREISDTLEFGVAASAWKHSVEGDVNLASREEIEQLVKGERVGVLLR